MQVSYAESLTMQYSDAEWCKIQEIKRRPPKGRSEAVLRQAVRMLECSGLNVSEICKDLGLDHRRVEYLLYGWKQKRARRMEFNGQTFTAHNFFSDNWNISNMGKRGCRAGTKTVLKQGGEICRSSY